MSRNNRRSPDVNQEMELPTPNAQRSTLNDQLQPIQVENRARTYADTRTGRLVCASIGHQSVRASDKSRPSRLRQISVNRSNVSRVALPTHVRSTISSPSVAGAL